MKIHKCFKSVLMATIFLPLTFYRWSIQRHFSESYKRYLKEFKVFNLCAHHLENCRLVPDRLELLRLLPKNAIIAEIGVANGDFTECIEKVCLPKKLYLIDVFNSKRYGDASRRLIESRFSSQIVSGKIVLKLGMSIDVLKEFPNEYFDWVYLDTDHTYSTTCQELDLLKFKVKKNGIISGHDYSMFNLRGDLRYGVIEAVHKMMVEDSWEIIYLSMETAHDRSFAIKRMA